MQYIRVKPQGPAANVVEVTLYALGRQAIAARNSGITPQFVVAIPFRAKFCVLPQMRLQDLWCIGDRGAEFPGERWRKSLKGECIRLGTPCRWKLGGGWCNVEHHNKVCLNRAIGYIKPRDILAGASG